MVSRILRARGFVPAIQRVPFLPGAVWRGLELFAHAELAERHGLISLPGGVFDSRCASVRFTPAPHRECNGVLIGLLSLRAVVGKLELKGQVVEGDGQQFSGLALRVCCQLVPVLLARDKHVDGLLRGLERLAVTVEQRQG